MLGCWYRWRGFLFLAVVMALLGVGFLLWPPQPDNCWNSCQFVGSLG